MVLLTPKFAFVAALASLTAFSLAPTADAAAITVRRSHQHYPSDSPARLTSASGKHTQDRNGESSRGSLKRQSPRDFFAWQRRSLTPEDLPPLLTRRGPQHQRPQRSHDRPLPPATAQQSTQVERGAGPYVHVDGANSHVAFDRRSPVPFPDPRHHHHHHHDDHHHGSKHADDVVVIEGDNDNVHIDRRSPRHHHHHHHGHGHHGGHGGGDKVIIKGDDNNVSVRSWSRFIRYRRHGHSPEHAEVTTQGHQHHVHARKYIPLHQPHRGGPSTNSVEDNKSAHHSDEDRTENRRSVLINSVEGEEKYFVPDDYQGQRVTVIEGDGISEVLTKAKRGDPGIEGVPGSVEIVSQKTMSEDGQRIASLVLVQPDGAMAEAGNSTFVLNASESNSTQLYLVALNRTNSGVQGEDVPVALKVPVFNPDSASMEGYCATYDPQPPAPAPLSAEPCFYDEPTAPHKSQVFAYTPSTSVIRPMWFGGETDEEDSFGDPSSNSTAQPDATVDPATPLSGNVTSITSAADFGNSTVPPSSIAGFDNSTEEGLTSSGSGNGSAVPSTEDFAAKAQNVTLIFTPATPIIPSSSKEDVPDSEETPLSGSNSTDTDTSAVPLASSASGRSNDTETGWTGSSDDSETIPSSLPAASAPLPDSVPSKTVSPAAVPSGSGVPGESQDLNVVMVDVARDEGSGGVGGRDSSMKAVSTAPYKWKFDRERS